MQSKQFDIVVILANQPEAIDTNGNWRLRFAVRERGAKWSDIAPQRELPKLLLATTLVNETYRLPEFRAGDIFIDTKVYIAGEASLEFDKLICRMGLMDVNDALCEMVADFISRTAKK